MGWLDHDRLGFNYRLSDLPARSGSPSSSGSTSCSAQRARVAALYREGLADVEGLELPCEDRGGDRRSWFVYVVQLPRGRRPRRAP